jgi:hypothetical protein
MSSTVTVRFYKTQSTANTTFINYSSTTAYTFTVPCVSGTITVRIYNTWAITYTTGINTRRSTTNTITI